jgi:hypothetical protein
VFAPIHDPDDDRPGIGRYFNQIEACFGGYLAGFFDRDDADLLTIGTD